MNRERSRFMNANEVRIGRHHLITYLSLANRNRSEPMLPRQVLIENPKCKSAYVFA